MMNKAGQWSQHEMGFCEAQGSKEAFFTFATSSGFLRDLISFLETPSFKMRYALLCVPEGKKVVIVSVPGKSIESS